MTFLFISFLQNKNRTYQHIKNYDKIPLINIGVLATYLRRKLPSALSLVIAHFRTCTFRKYPDKVLDFSATSYASNGYGHVYLSGYVHKRDDQRFIQKGKQIVLHWKSMGLVLDLKHNNAYATQPVIGCYPNHGGHAQTWTITFV